MKLTKEEERLFKKLKKEIRKQFFKSRQPILTATYNRLGA